jgi:hypothetical protein
MHITVGAGGGFGGDGVLWRPEFMMPQDHSVTAPRAQASHADDGP